MLHEANMHDTGSLSPVYSIHGDDGFEHTAFTLLTYRHEHEALSLKEKKEMSQKHNFPEK